MKRNALNLIIATSFIAAANAALANEAQPELQPARVEFGSFKYPVGATQYRTVEADTSAVQSQFRFITEASPL